MRLYPLAQTSALTTADYAIRFECPVEDDRLQRQ